MGVSLGLLRWNGVVDGVTRPKGKRESLYKGSYSTDVIIIPT